MVVKQAEGSLEALVAEEPALVEPQMSFLTTLAALGLVASVGLARARHATALSESQDLAHLVAAHCSSRTKDALTVQQEEVLISYLMISYYPWNVSYVSWDGHLLLCPTVYRLVQKLRSVIIQKLNFLSVNFKKLFNSSNKIYIKIRP